MCHLRTHGAQNGCIVGLAESEPITPQIIEAAVAALTARMTDTFPGTAKFVIPGEGAIMIDSEPKIPAIRSPNG